MESDIEIERKYLLSQVPSCLKGFDYDLIQQAYLPGKRIFERVRKRQKNIKRQVAGNEIDTQFTRTIKAGRGMTRIEIEEEINADFFEQLWALTQGSRLIKRRYSIPAAELLWEIDVFEDRELVLAEVELEHESIVPLIPKWLKKTLVREVTMESQYVNISLAF